MDASLKSEAERLAGEIASQATTVGDLNSLMSLMMKSAMERMLDTHPFVLSATEYKAGE